jgi:hypothetical protein
MARRDLVGEKREDIYFVLVCRRRAAKPACMPARAIAS